MGLCCAGSTEACRYAGDFLRSLGIPVHDAPEADDREILLDVPSFREDGRLRDGRAFREVIPEGARVIYGGNLQVLPEKDTVDFLKDPLYLAKNAAITANCALNLAGPELEWKWFGCPILVIGWGRIGKCLAKDLGAMGADVTVAARKETDRAMVSALGYHTADPGYLSDCMGHFRAVFNTVPAPVVGYQGDCFQMDLASKRGLLGPDVVWARGLPGKYAPMESGKLMAETWLRLRKE